MKLCRSCRSKIDFWATRCPYCTGKQLPTSGDNGCLVPIIMFILFVVFCYWYETSSPSSVAFDSQFAMERIMKKAGINTGYNTCSKREIDRQTRTDNQGRKLSQDYENLNNQLRDISERKNPDLYDKKVKEIDNALTESVIYSRIKEMNGYFYAIINCDGRDKVSEDIDEAYNIMKKAKKKLSKFYKKYPGLVVLED